MVNKIINNINDFQQFLLDKSHPSYNLSGNYRLNANIDWVKIESHLQKPIDNFTGQFDGNGFSLINFSLFMKSNNYISLFSNLTKGEIKNFNLVIDGEISGNSYVSALVSYAENSVISYCKISGNLKLNSTGPNCGIIVGSAKDTIIENVTVEVNNTILRGVKTLGAFAGNLEKCNISNCQVKGSISIVGSFTDSNDLAGFVGFSSFSKISNCIVNFSGSIIGKNNVSGFVSIDYLSEFLNCEMNINGNLTSFSNTNLFCCLSIEPNYSKFENCFIGIKTQINGVLVNIFNIQKYSKIGNTLFNVLVNNSYYSSAILNLLDLRNKIVDESGLIFQIFDYILTLKQLSSLKICNFLIVSEKESANIILEKFKSKWNNLDESDKKSFSNIGFNNIKFNELKFPNIKWENFTRKQRQSALHLGFNKNVWNNKIVQKLANNSYIYKESNNGLTINFEIRIDKLTLKLPSYIRDIILIEIKNFLTEIYTDCLPNYKSLNLYYKSDDSLDIIIIFSNEIDIDDDICNSDVNNNGVIEIVEKFLLIDINYDNFVFVNKYFNENEGEYVKFLKNMINELIKVEIDCPYTIEILDYNNNFKQIKAKVSLSESHSKLIEDKDDLNPLSSNMLIRLLKNCLPEDLLSYPKSFDLKWKTYEDKSNLDKDFIDEIEYNKFAVCTSIEQLNNKVGYHTPFSTIIANVIINKDFATERDVLLIYVDNELRGHGQVNLLNDIPLINTKFFVKNSYELLCFKVYKCNQNLLFEVPDLKLKIKPGDNLGSLENPVQIEAKGRIPPAVTCLESIEIDEVTKYYTNQVKIFGFVIINYNFAEKGDIVLVYVNNELRGYSEIYLYNKISYVNLTVYSSGVEEEINVCILQKSSLKLFEVPDLSLKIKPGAVFGSNISPIKLRAIGKVPVLLEDYLNYVDENTLFNLSHVVNACTQTEVCEEEECKEEVEIPVESINEVCEPIIDKKTFINYVGLASLNNKKPKKKVVYSSKKCGTSGCGTSGSGV